MAEPAAYEAEALAIAQEKDTLRARIAVRAAYRRLFMVNGAVSEAGKAVLADLMRHARFGKHNPLASADELRERAALRGVILHIFARLDPEALADLSDKLNRRTGK